MLINETTIRCRARSTTQTEGWNKCSGWYTVPWVHVELNCVIWKLTKSVDGASLKKGCSQGAGWYSWAQNKRQKGPELQQSIGQTQEHLAEVSGLCLGRREESQDQGQLPENTSNQLSLPLSFEGEEMKNNKLNVTSVFHSQLVAVKIFFCHLFSLEMVLHQSHALGVIT